jgi:hypothetical protein
MFFSQRKGYKPVSQIIQKDGISEELRNTLWNILDLLVWSNEHFLVSKYDNARKGIETFSKILWLNYFKKPIDTRFYSNQDDIQTIREYFFSCEWYEVYDFLEFTLRYFDEEKLTETVNGILERELSAYRFINDIFTDITDEQEIKMLEDALRDDNFPGVSKHLKRALELLSDRENPDYRNSIKESISAVESFAKVITGKPKASLGQALNIIEREGKLHPSLLEAFSKLYGYASDEGGIRHAMLEDPNLTPSDAKFFLMSCTSFINYMKAKLQ